MIDSLELRPGMRDQIDLRNATETITKIIPKINSAPRSVGCENENRAPTLERSGFSVSHRALGVVARFVLLYLWPIQSFMILFLFLAAECRYDISSTSRKAQKTGKSLNSPAAVYRNEHFASISAVI